MFILVLICLGLPVFTLFFTFFSLPYVILAAAGLVMLTCCLHHTWATGADLKKLQLSNKTTRLLVLVVIALVFVVITIVSPFDWADWHKHYAIINLLVDNDWPPVFALNGDSYVLRYGLGWYVLPALLTKLAGAKWMTSALCIWTAICLSSILLLAFEGIQKKRHMLISMLVFFLFSGLDLIAAWLSGYDMRLSPDWLQWWSGWGQISPNMFGLTWVPQHALAGWAGAVLFFKTSRLALQYAVVILVFVAMWSPLSAAGVVPIAIWALYKEGGKSCLTPSNFLAVPLLAAPALLYLTMSITSSPGLGMWLSGPGYLDLLIFWLIEFLLVAIIILLAKPTNVSLIAIVAIFLACACLIKIDSPNNWLMRSSIPSMCILALFAAQALLHSTGWRKYLLSLYLGLAAVPVLVATAVGIAPLQGT